MLFVSIWFFSTIKITKFSAKFATTTKTVKYCAWYRKDMWMIPQRYVDDTSKIFGWYRKDIWMIPQRYVDDTATICEWYRQDIWMLPQQYVDDTTNFDEHCYRLLEKIPQGQSLHNLTRSPAPSYTKSVFLDYDGVTRFACYKGQCYAKELHNSRK